MIKTFGIGALGLGRMGKPGGSLPINLEPQYRILSDGTTKVRIGIRDCNWVRDITLTPLGFDGAENIDWENQESEPLA